MKTIELICEKESLLDGDWLFNNIPWSNHDNSIAKISFDSPIEVYAIKLDGYDSQKTELKKFYFDNVVILAVHGFGGNNYSFTFQLGDDKTHVSFDETNLGFSVDEVKNRYIDKLNRKIKGLQWQIGYAETSIEKISKLNLGE